jgi:hypothetical protein
MRRVAAFATLLALAAVPGVRADGGLLLASAGSSIGAQATAGLVPMPSANLGVFASRWDSQDYGTLTGYGVRFGWNFFRNLGLEARASYLESKDERVDTTLIPLEAALTWRFHFGQHLSPYLGGGIGYYMKEAEIDDAESWSSSENVAGYFALAGLNLHLGAFSFFAEGKYNLIGTDDDLHWRGADVEAQNSLDGLSLNAGLKLGF